MALSKAQPEQRDLLVRFICQADENEQKAPRTFTEIQGAVIKWLYRFSKNLNFPLEKNLIQN